MKLNIHTVYKCIIYFSVFEVWGVAAQGAPEHVRRVQKIYILYLREWNVRIGTNSYPLNERALSGVPKLSSSTTHPDKNNLFQDPPKYL